MDVLDRLMPAPWLLECDHVDVAAPPDEVWPRVRHGELGRSPWVRALFALRTLPGRVIGKPVEAGTLRIDNLRSTPETPGFAVLVEEGREVAIGAVGKVWQGDIPFVHVDGAAAFAAFRDPGFVRVAWALRVLPLGARDSRVEVEVRVDATDEESWHKFRRYFRVIGIGSHFIRHSLLGQLARDLGTPGAREEERPLDGDELLPGAAGLTRAITIAATPAQIWPWLLQMGYGRGGFYSLDALDNGNVGSARELHPEWAHLRVGDVIPADDRGGGFEVLRIEPERALVLGGLYDVEDERQLPFAAAHPERFWQVTWAFVLEPLDAEHTRLHARARALFSPSERLHAAWIRPVHRLMEWAQLRHLAARAEERLPPDGWRDVLAGMGGAARIVANLMTPFLRRARSHWGLGSAEAARPLPGDELVPDPRWTWTHAVEIDAPAGEVWPWIAQIGAERGGFYSYQWLENLAGCGVRNAERVHPEWQAKLGDPLSLHPRMPPLRIVAFAPERHLVAFAGDAVSDDKPWVRVSWLFHLEPLGEARCRFISRYRCASSSDLSTRIGFGPTLIEPVGFAMDRRMLLGVKQRAEQHARPVYRLGA